MWWRVQRWALVGGTGLLLAGFLVGALSMGADVLGGGPAAEAAPRTNVRLAGGVQAQRPTEPLTSEERIGLRALSMVDLRWEELLPGWRIEFRPARRGYLAMTYRVDRRIEVFVRPDRPVPAIARDIAHELGHALDVTLLDDRRRATYLALRGLPASTSWWACDSCRDLRTGAGDFAEAFAWWAAPRYRFYGELAPAPSDAVLEQLATQVFPEATGFRGRSS